VRRSEGVKKLRVDMSQLAERERERGRERGERGERE
jgi:hypothetical protein